MQWQRASALVALTLILVGCRAPKPSMNVFAPFGSSRVPAPATSDRSSGGYYQTPAQPSNIPPGGRIGVSQADTPESGRLNAEQPSAESEVYVAQAGFDGPLEASRVRMVESSQATQSIEPLRLNGMPVSDGTRQSPEPARFQPPQQLIEITELPSAKAAGQASARPSRHQLPSVLIRPRPRAQSPNPPSSPQLPPVEKTGQGDWRAR